VIYQATDFVTCLELLLMICTGAVSWALQRVIKLTVTET